MGFQLRDVLIAIPPGLKVKPPKAESPPEERPQIRCPSDKVPFATRATARAELARVNTMHGEAMNVYRCHFCEHYHLGHRR